MIYTELASTGARLMRWRLGEPAAHEVAPLDMPPSVFDAQHALAGVARPLSWSLDRYACYDTQRDRIAMIDLTDATRREAEPHTRSAVWWNDQWLVAADNDRVLLISSEHVVNDSGEPLSLRLIQGRWAPVWANHQQNSLVLVGPHPTKPDTLSLLQLWLVVSDDSPGG